MITEGTDSALMLLSLVFGTITTQSHKKLVCKKV